MARFFADEGFKRPIVHGMRDRNPSVDIVRVQDVGMQGAPDPDILEWAAQQGRIVLTHDEHSMLRDANARLIAGLPMPGVVLVRHTTPTGPAIEGLLEMVGASLEGEWENQIRFVQK